MIQHAINVIVESILDIHWSENVAEGQLHDISLCTHAHAHAQSKGLGES